MGLRSFWEKLCYTLSNDIQAPKAAPLKPVAGKLAPVILHEKNALIAARHEAGHTLAAYKVGWKVSAIQFQMNGNHFINAKSTYDEGNEKDIADAIYFYVESTALYDALSANDKQRALEIARKRCFVLLGGPAAEHIYSGQPLTQNFGLYDGTPDKYIYDRILCFLHGTKEDYNAFFERAKKEMVAFFNKNETLAAVEKIATEILSKQVHHLTQAEIEDIFTTMNFSFH